MSVPASTRRVMKVWRRSERHVPAIAVLRLLQVGEALTPLETNLLPLKRPDLPCPHPGPVGQQNDRHHVSAFLGGGLDK